MSLFCRAVLNIGQCILPRPVLHFYLLTTHLYDEQIYIGVIAVTQACCAPVLQNSGECILPCPTVRLKLTVLTAGHERKHNACRAEIERCISAYTYISRVKALRMWVEALLKSAIRHRQVLVHRIRHKADRLLTGALELLLPAVCTCLSPWSVDET